MAALRVGLAAVVLADLAARAADLGVFYTDAGVLPRAALRDPEATLPPLSVHLAAGSAAGVAALFVLAALAAIALGAGVAPRLAALLSWLFAISLQHRNPTLLSGGDQLLALLLLWCAFAPLGRGGARPLRSAGTAAIVIQVGAVHLCAGLFKLLESPAWRDGTALALALQDVSVSRWGAALRAHPDLTRALTWAVLGLEILGPLILLSPIRSGPLRAASVLSLIALHLGVALCLQVGIFPFVSAVALLALTPAWLWDRLRVPAPREAPADPGGPARWQEALCATLLALVIWANVGGLWARARPPAPIASALAWAGLAQEWSMYVDLREPSGWFRITGARLDGSEVRLLLEGAPPDDARRYQNLRWHAYMGALARREGLRRLLAEHLCRRGEGAPLRRVEIRFDCQHFCGAQNDAPPPPPRELIPCPDAPPEAPDAGPR